jgi:hypothetical protein
MAYHALAGVQNYKTGSYGSASLLRRACLRSLLQHKHDAHLRENGRKMSKQAKCSPYELSMEARIDSKHVRRLLSGESHHPSRCTVLELAQALLDLSGETTLDDVDRLLSSAGKGSLRRERIVVTRS